ncbi:MAG: chorismate synthase [Dehalococcoidia bacterium]|nr:chorismate synthase [Dehalococcoidia bacterium]
MGTFRFLTGGESHGRALSAIVEGVPAGLALSEEYIARDLRRRQGGYGRGARQQIEEDRAEILSGVRHGLTLGSPITLIVRNRDWENWRKTMSIEPADVPVEKVTRLRPGHADVAGAMKYGHDDVRSVLERASARETAARVAVGAVARRLLEEIGVSINSHTVAIGGIQAKIESDPDWQKVEASPLRCADAAAEKRMAAAIDQARENGDSLGGVTEVRASGVPIGLGSHVHWDRRLDGLLAQALMSVPSVKGVEVGEGSRVAETPGSQAHDLFLPVEEWAGRPWRRATNRAGGIEGGISNGETIVLRAALKPISTLPKAPQSLDLVTGEPVEAHYERADVCVVPAAGVIAEAMAAIVLAGAVLEKFGGDHMDETLRNYRAYIGSVGPRQGGHD